MLRKSLHLDPSLGASSDMILGALVGLGVKTPDIESQVSNAGFGPISVTTQTVIRGGIEGVTVMVEPQTPIKPSKWSEIDDQLKHSDLPGRISAGARSTFKRLARSIAEVQQEPLQDVEIANEAGFNSIITAIAVWAAIAKLDIDLVSSSSIGLGYGSAVKDDIREPLPNPTTLKLLEGLPVKYLELEGETVTKTGAALLSTLVETWDVSAEGYIVNSSRGAGSRNPGTHSNVLTATLLQQRDLENSVTNQSLVKLETNLDDTTAEVLEYCIQKVTDAGATDAWSHPVTMRRGRSGVTLVVLCENAIVDDLKEIMFRQTKTLGIKESIVQRTSAWRRVDTVTVEGQEVRIKVGPYGAKPEYSDLVTLAESLDVPLRRLSSRVIEQYLGKD